MDIDLENRAKEVIEELKQLSIEQIDFNEMDPIVKMMLVTLINESQKIQDYIGNLEQRIVDRFCSDFIPYNKIGAIPAIAILAPEFKPKKDSDVVSIGSNCMFSYKSTISKHALNFLPLFRTLAIPHHDLYTLTPSRLQTRESVIENVSMKRSDCLWLGIAMKKEVECLRGMSILIMGTRGIAPEHIYCGGDKSELEFATMAKMESVEMAEPFDAQQSSGQFFSHIESWKERLLNMENATLLYITDERVDRDLFKQKTFPKSFTQELEDNVLNNFDHGTLWLCLEFPKGYIVPNDCRVVINALPVVNVERNNLTLTQASPIAKLQKQDDAFFLCVTETSVNSQQQGFNAMDQDVIIRDFDASRYHNGDLYRDVRNLYNRFIDDYYAFIEYNGIKDGEALRRLRQTINQIGKSVGVNNSKFKFDSGTYVMKNMNGEQNSSTVNVTYLTTQGRIGNTPQAGEKMENKKNLPAIEQKVDIVVSAMGGCDKASADERYELLRYFTLTNDRLYTKMDVDAFLRKEIIAEFGKEEFKRIFIKLSIEGAAGKTSLNRGLYIDIEFKDLKNYNKAVDMALDKQLLRKINNKSCIAMPINIRLIDLDV